MQKPYFCNECAVVRGHIRKKGVAAILEIFTTLYHSRMYKYAFVWQTNDQIFDLHLRIKVMAL